MKKLLISFLLVFLITGCANSSTLKKSVIQEIDMSNFIDSENRDFELLRVTDEKIYINELDTSEDSFLFTTKSLLVLDQVGKLKKKYEINTNKRIVDFIDHNGKTYYFNLIEENHKYYIELCNFNERSENIIKRYLINDPYAYPKFISYNNSYCYKINKTLYDLDSNHEIFNQDTDFYLAKSSSKNTYIYFKSHAESHYQLNTLIKNKVKYLKLKDNFGNFLVNNDLVIFESNDNGFLYSFNLKINQKRLLFDKAQVLDFILLDNMIVVINTEDKIYYLNIQESNMICEINKKEKSLNDTIGWMQTDNEDSIYINDNRKVYRISVTN